MLDRFRTISTANGYQTECGSNVFDWQEQDPLEPELCPAVVVRPVKGDISPRTSGTHEHAITYDVFLVVADSDTVVSDLAKARADLYRSIDVVTDGFTGARWSGLAIDTQMTAWTNEVEMSERKHTSGVSKCTLVVRHRTASFDPYTQTP